MCADIYTKAFTDPEKWRHAHELVNIMDSSRVQELAKELTDWKSDPEPQVSGPAATSGGIQAAHGSVSADVGGYRPTLRRGSCHSGEGIVCADPSKAAAGAASNAGGHLRTSTVTTPESLGLWGGQQRARVPSDP